MIKDSIDKMLDENIVDHVPDITESTGTSPLPEQSAALSEESSSSISESFAGGNDDLSQDHQEPASTKLDITQKENVAISRFKLLIFGILCMCAVGISTVVYVYLNGEENKDFNIVYESYAFQIFGSVGTQLEQNLATVDSFALGLVSYATFSNATWPFVTMPDSAVRMSKVRGQTKSSIVQILHLVSESNREEYETYTIENFGWANETLDVQAEDESLLSLGIKLTTDVQVSSTIAYSSGQPVPVDSGPYTATWQGYPLVEVLPSFNVDFLSNAVLGPALEKSILDQTVVLSEAATTSAPVSEPAASLFFPILQDSESVAVMNVAFQWRSFFEDVLREGERGLLVVVKNTCSQVFSYRIDGPNANFLGLGDKHDKKYNDFELAMGMADLQGSAYTGVPLDTEFCAYTIKTYPTEDMEDDVKTIIPLLFLFGTICIFILSAVIFTVYDMLVNFRQKKVLKAAEESNAIVSQLFPENVRDRLFKKEQEKNKNKKDKKKGYQPNNTKMKNFLSDASTDGGDMDMMDHDEFDDRPIADLFPETTVMFADIAGFTAWSSVREPVQVFILLEKIYGAFDRIATRRGVFKVETIGDSYVAVCGLPEPRVDHAVVMVKFADQCRGSFSEITRDLEFTLGPETGDLRMRFGLNSGPTTAGVLRGQKSRFQLFGDTVNTAARMESTGEKNCIQVSQTTADLLISSKKEHWLDARADKIDVKGKGLMQTYFADPQKGNALSISMHSESVESTMAEQAHKNERMVYWCTDIMAKLLRQVVARREASYRTGGENSTLSSMDQMSLDSSVPSVGKKFKKTGHVIEEVAEVIAIPEYDPTLREVPESEITLSPDVMKQLREYVTKISETYRENPFHNFEHASHVVMSVAKLLSRIVAPDSVFKDNSSRKNLDHALHDYTYGITSDPLTQFACVFAALIHDSDHYGIPNNQLVQEKSPLAHKYRNRSPAEQNSVAIAWKILMKPQFSALRGTICPSEEEMIRFRQLVINSVMATDIADKDMKTLRNNRWATAFSDQTASKESERTNINRKATIVIEHLIQASDVAHTMQHWHVYTKWNERLFQEMSLAFLVGRADKDPVEFWYKGELGFYDFYIIPLAKKLSECGVFGVSSDEYLNYAVRNREEWERRGEEILQGMIERFQVKLRDEYGDLGRMSASNASLPSVETSIREE